MNLKLSLTALPGQRRTHGQLTRRQGGRVCFKSQLFSTREVFSFPCLYWDITSSHASPIGSLSSSGADCHFYLPIDSHASCPEPTSQETHVKRMKTGRQFHPSAPPSRAPLAGSPLDGQRGESTASHFHTPKAGHHWLLAIRLSYGFSFASLTQCDIFLVVQVLQLLQCAAGKRCVRNSLFPTCLITCIISSFINCAGNITSLILV